MAKWPASPPTRGASRWNPPRSDQATRCGPLLDGLKKEVMHFAASLDGIESQGLLSRWMKVEDGRVGFVL
jgi:hypothetical protein